jgi:hypothetical protein
VFINRLQMMRLSRLSLALALAIGSTSALAQSTTGSIFGQAPVAEGESVQVKSTTGISREVAVDANGRYTVGSLPLGTYTVALIKDGSAVDSRNDVNAASRFGYGSVVRCRCRQEPGLGQRIGQCACRPST